MLTMLQKRRDEEGFTLIELMVVVLIIAILIAIAIPAFLGARERANHRAAQSDLRNALTAASTYFTDNQEFDGLDETVLASVETNLEFAAAATTDAIGVVVDEAADTVCLTKISKSDALEWSIFVDPAGDGTLYGQAADCSDTTAFEKAGFPPAP